MTPGKKKVWWVWGGGYWGVYLNPQIIQKMIERCECKNITEDYFSQFSDSFIRCPDCMPEEFVYQEEKPFWKPNEFVGDINYWVYDFYKNDWEYWNGGFEPNVNPHICPCYLEEGLCGNAFCFACYPENISFQKEEEKPDWIPGEEKEEKLRQTPQKFLQFQGHLKACHASYWHNYEKCSCGVALQSGKYLVNCFTEITGKQDICISKEKLVGDEYVGEHNEIETPFVSEINLDWD